MTAQPDNTIDSEVDSILTRLEGVTRSDTADAMNGRPMSRTFGVDDNPRATAHTAITNLIAQEAKRAMLRQRAFDQKLIDKEANKARLDEIQKIVDWGKTIDDQWNAHFKERLKELRLTADKELNNG